LNIYERICLFPNFKEIVKSQTDKQTRIANIKLVDRKHKKSMSQIINELLRIERDKQLDLFIAHK